MVQASEGSRFQLNPQDRFVQGCLEWEQKMLALPVERIWGSYLPQKVKRILALKSLGFTTNPLIFVSGQQLRDNPSLAIEGLRQNREGDYQASTSTMVDGLIIGNPILQIDKRDNRKKIAKKLTDCENQFISNYQTGLKETGIPLVPEGQEGEWFWENSMFIFYTNHWKGKKKKNMVGGRWAVDTRLRTPRRHREDVILIEAAPGIMGRTVGMEQPGSRHISFGKLDKHIGLDGYVWWTSTGDPRQQIDGLTKAPKKQEMLRNRVVRKMERLLTQSPEFRVKVAALQKLVGSNQVVVDWAWDQRENEIWSFDFDFFDPENFIVLPDRNPQAETYAKIERIEVVHLSSYGVQDVGNWRKRVIWSRFNHLSQQGIPIKEITDFNSNLEGIEGKMVVVGGLKLDGCVRERARRIRKAGGIPIIDKALCMKFYLEPDIEWFGDFIK